MVSLVLVGTGALKEFKVTINRQWRFKGIKRSFISGQVPEFAKVEGTR